MTSVSPTFHAVVAMAENRVIGREGQLPWHLPADLQFFKKLTLDHPILMGRKTYDSIGRPLPRRRNLVLTRQPFSQPGVEALHSLEDLAALGLSGSVFLIGGGEIYRCLLPYCQGVYLTQVHRQVEGDAYFPEFEAGFLPPVTLEEHDEFTIYHYVRREATTPLPARDGKPAGIEKCP
jgi:dihydrofolate reductase